MRGAGLDLRHGIIPPSCPAETELGAEGGAFKRLRGRRGRGTLERDRGECYSRGASTGWMAALGVSHPRTPGNPGRPRRRRAGARGQGADALLTLLLLMRTKWSRRAPEPGPLGRPGPSGGEANREDVSHLRRLLDPERARGAGADRRPAAAAISCGWSRVSSTGIASRRSSARPGRGRTRRPRSRSCAWLWSCGAGRRCRSSRPRSSPTPRSRASRSSASRSIERADRPRAPAGPSRGSHRRAQGADRRASAAGGPARPADARPLPLRPPGGGPPGLSGLAPPARRDIRDRAEAEAAGARAGRSSARDAALEPELPRQRRRGPAGAFRACGRPKPASDVRKTVTILFADLVNSSQLSLALDPEALRNLLARYFGELSAIVRAARRNRGEVHR